MLSQLKFRRHTLLKHTLTCSDFYSKIPFNFERRFLLNQDQFKKRWVINFSRMPGQLVGFSLPKTFQVCLSAVFGRNSKGLCYSKYYDLEFKLFVLSKWPNVILKLHLHTYIIGHYNPYSQD